MNHKEMNKPINEQINTIFKNPSIWQLINILCGPVAEHTAADCVEFDLREKSEFV